jgi:hypothetical protein
MFCAAHGGGKRCQYPEGSGMRVTRGGLCRRHGSEAVLRPILLLLIPGEIQVLFVDWESGVLLLLLLLLLLLSYAGGRAHKDGIHVGCTSLGLLLCVCGVD